MYVVERVGVSLSRDSILLGVKDFSFDSEAPQLLNGFQYGDHLLFRSSIWVRIEESDKRERKISLVKRGLFLLLLQVTSFNPFMVCYISSFVFSRDQDHVSGTIVSYIKTRKKKTNKNLL